MGEMRRKPPFLLRGVNDLRQHHGHRGLSPSMSVRRRNLKLPYPHDSFAGQHPHSQLPNEIRSHHVLHPRAKVEIGSGGAAELRSWPAAGR